jgi:hypothetical protein
MNCKVKYIPLLILVFFFISHSQTGDIRNITIKFMGLSIHPTAKPSTQDLVRKLDDIGRYVMNMGVSPSGE